MSVVDSLDSEEMYAPSTIEEATRGIFYNELNFCLSPVDSAVSKESDTKVLNKLSNKVMKQVLIGADFSQEIDVLKKIYDGKVCDQEDEKCENQLQYLKCVSSLAEGKQLDYMVKELDPFYQKSYDKILSILKESQCNFVSSEEEKGVTIVSKAKEKDFCLSVYDFRSDEPTKTKELNTIANQISLMLRYGTESEIGQFALQLEIRSQNFLTRWELEASSQEAIFYTRMRELLNEGSLRSRNLFEGLNGAYLNAFERLFSDLIRELTASSIPASYKVTSSFTSWERELRKNSTAPFWNENPIDLVGDWQLLDDRNEAAVWGRPSNLVEDEDLDEITVITFKKDGTVALPTKNGAGLRWYLEPGPTHLDTLHFQVATDAKMESIYTYVGYIDRGQRLETKFSGRPILVKGRVIFNYRGQEKAVNKFIMEQQKSKRRRGSK
eukprot:CAMPEP_0117757082 /NCGR_PEP_ID=MMETSP0947-20121206/14498_1 /TAXON_ID=44440 /ORGANISM="Chattonella subsalsa, Strain CCMP2191" /LENGTH=438 /DNA_ID=CAMNT_0005576865 /DNA_START=236 /DNA_END=1552 /DNA_ORIENTATION=-